MKLYLIQHGQALSKEEDPRRPLSEKGKLQTERMAAFMRSKGIEAGVLWHSKKLRAVQTAKIIARAIEGISVIERDDINPLDPPDSFPARIRETGRDLIIVGHLPFLSKLTSLLLAGLQEYEIVSFVNSGIVCLERRDVWRIGWFVRPELV